MILNLSSIINLLSRKKEQSKNWNLLILCVIDHMRLFESKLCSSALVKCTN